MAARARGSFLIQTALATPSTCSVKKQESTKKCLCCLYKENLRGSRLADLAAAVKSGRPIRANMEQLFHVSDVMTAFKRSSDKKAREEIHSPFERQAPMEKAKIIGLLEN